MISNIYRIKLCLISSTGIIEMYYQCIIIICTCAWYCSEREGKVEAGGLKEPSRVHPL